MSRRFPGVVSLCGDLELNEKLMGERCGGILEDACERVSLEEGVVEELIFFSDDEDETDEVSGGAFDDSRTKDSDSRNVSPAGVNYGSELAEEENGDCVRESGLVCDPGENPILASGSRVVHGVTKGWMMWMGPYCCWRCIWRGTRLRHHGTV